MEDVGFRVWKYKKNSAWYRVLASKALREQTIDDNLDESNKSINIKTNMKHQVVFLVNITLQA